MLNWILNTFSRAELPPDFMPYTTEEIARLRRPPLANVSAVREQLMAELAAAGAGAAFN